MAWDLAKLLQPFEAETFLEHSWQRSPLHVRRNDTTYYRGLFARSDVEAIISWHPLKEGDIRLAGAAAEPYQAKLFHQRSGGIDRTNLRQARANGASVVLEMVQWRVPSVGALCRAFETLFRQPVTANSILTPRASMGFDVHFDYLDVFVLQVEGTKRWRVYRPLVELPVPEQFRSPLDRARLGSPSLDVELMSGDLLFIPRGFPHEAEATGHESLQVGVGVHPYRIADLVVKALEQLAETDVVLRRGIPPGALAAGAEAELSRMFSERLAHLSSKLHFEPAYEQLLSQHSAWMRKVCAPELGGSSAAIDAQTRLQLCHEMPCYLLARATTPTLHFPGGSRSIPVAFLPALDEILKGAAFQLGSLPGSVDENLDMIQSLVAAGVLVKRGVLAGA